ncbi:MAG: hypothetical protein IT343_06805, partial [Candidatus Melainabacteria bacterium]|nr:hypothetical protein [Candidatus Melainabacteria bacterium]
LDGGHLAFMCYEAIRGKPVEERTQGEIVKWGFLSLIVLMVVIMFNDVTALMTGKLSFKAMKEKAKEVRQQRESLNSPGSVDADPSGSKTPAAQDANKTDAPPADAPASEVKPAEPAPAH